jgi:hypothetical protein
MAHSKSKASCKPTASHGRLMAIYSGANPEVKESILASTSEA